MKGTPDEMALRNEFLGRLGLALTNCEGEDGPPQKPFSFCLNGPAGGCDEISWQCSISGEGETYNVSWVSEHPALRVQADVRCFADDPAVDYLCRFAAGETESPVLSELLALDTVIDLPETRSLVLRHCQGSTAKLDDFLPLSTCIPLGEQLSFVPRGGRSSNGVLPFFLLDWGGEGLVLAVGWSGQWKVEFLRDGTGAVRLTVGLERTRLKLRANESICLPRILIVGWHGEERSRGHNLMRRLLLDHYVPRRQGKPVDAPLSHNTAATACLRIARCGENANESTELQAIARCAELGLGAYWMDAYWFPWPWHRNVGTWRPREADFPRGLRVLADEAHARRLRFVLWYEPERVYENSDLDNAHPEFLIRLEGNGNRLLNLGDSAARRYITDFISDEIERNDVDVYRQDFNIDPLPYWRSLDAPDRIGMTEIRYIEGLYAFWDELRARRPGLVIDNCASGGRRIDLETLSRSIPLWRSDYNDGAYSSPKLRSRPAPTADQIQTAGLNLFIPSVHTGAVGRYDPYGFRSAASTGAALYTDTSAPDFPDMLARKGVAECRRLRPYRLGDFYTIGPVCSDATACFGHQYHRPEHEDGVAVYFFREECTRRSMKADLHAIDPAATYRIVVSETYDVRETGDVSGRDLTTWPVTAEKIPAAVLIEYRRT